ncbi:MAG: tyrosine-type recombinase/integrase [Chloroflexi bacterium]|nr:tyrosine-type recombinase/integrase [Chloroflexota bacterium]
MPSKRRSHGEGSITPRGAGKWRLRYDGPPGTNGSRRQVSETVRGTKVEASRVLRERIRALETGTYVKSAKLTTADYLQQWQKRHGPNIAPRTAEGYASMTRNYLLPAIGRIPLQALESAHLDNMYDEMRDRGLSSATVAHTHRTLRKALNDAIRIKPRLIESNPCHAVATPSQKRKEKPVWTLLEIQYFMDLVEGHEFETLFKIALMTGLRRSELAGLMWSDIDLKTGAMTISRNLQRISGQGLAIGGTKNGRTRPVKLGLQAIRHLKTVRATQLEHQLKAGTAWNATGFVFTDQVGQPYDSGRFTKEFKRVIRKSDLDSGLTLHSTRRAHVSLLASRGVHIKTISERIGHASSAFTMDIYQDVLPDMQDQAASAIDEALGG